MISRSISLPALPALQVESSAESATLPAEGQSPSHDLATATFGSGLQHLPGLWTITNLECIQLVDQVDRLKEQYHFHGVKLDLIAIGYCEACWRKMEPQTTL